MVEERRFTIPINGECELVLTVEWEEAVDHRNF